MCVFSNSDSSHANVDDVELGEKTKSQFGYVAGFCNKEIINNELDGRFLPVDIASATIKRVCRSTFTAEANGALEGAEAAQHLRHLVAELRGAPLGEIDSRSLVVPCVWIVDAMSLVDALNKDCGTISNKRVRLLVAELKQMLAEDGDIRLIWADTLVMLADCLTKLEAERGYLLAALSSGRWSPCSTPESLAAKEKIRAARKARKNRGKIVDA